MEELILIRHGESQYNALLTDNLNSNLTEVGIHQARKTGKFLKEHFGDLNDFMGIVSPYKRCLQTAAVIREETKINFRIHTGPREVMIKYETVEIENLSNEFPEFTWDTQDSWKFERETPRQFMDRMDIFCQYLKQQTGKILVVSHGTPVNTLHGLVSKLPHERTDAPNLKTYVENCSITYMQGKTEVWFGKTVF